MASYSNNDFQVLWNRSLSIGISAFPSWCLFSAPISYLTLLPLA